MPNIAHACPDKNKTYVIGVQAIDYSPHYNFIQQGKANFFGDFVLWLSEQTQCNFQVKVLPIKRLNAEFEKTDNIDFVYPDNPNWHDSAINAKRYYSKRLVTALGGTMVKPEHELISIEQFTNLAFPRGFSPVAWYPLQAKYGIQFTETLNATSALKMVLVNRVDGADIELNVARYLIDKAGMEPLVLAKNLPFTPTGFHLSTYRETALLEQINTLISNRQLDLAVLKQKAKLIESVKLTASVH